MGYLSLSQCQKIKIKATGSDIINIKKIDRKDEKEARHKGRTRGGFSEKKKKILAVTKLKLLNPKY